jgi:heme-NO-binding protein
MGSVQGVILDEMRMYVVGAYGNPAWAEVVKRSGRPANHEYLSDKVYPDQELGLLAMQAAEVSGKPLADVLEGFGEALVPDMFKYYSILANPRWSFNDFLLGMEPLLHSALRLHAPEALPTKVHPARIGPGIVQIVYESPLRACAAVRGIIQGAAVHYGVEVEITEEKCALRGDPACVITVTGV